MGSPDSSPGSRFLSTSSRALHPWLREDSGHTRYFVHLTAGSTIVMGYRTYEVYDLPEKSPRTTEP
jgi:hypothetical protein